MTPEQWAAKTVHYGRPCKGPESMGRELGLCAFCSALAEDFRAAVTEERARAEALLEAARTALAADVYQPLPRESYEALRSAIAKAEAE